MVGEAELKPSSNINALQKGAGKLAPLICKRFLKCVPYLFSLLLVAHALAQEPTGEQKKAALLEAYRLNGNSMVGWGSIDLSKGVQATSDEAITCKLREGQATGALYFDCPQPTQHIRIIPTDKIVDRNLTPPPLECKKHHGVQKDDRCKQ